MTEEVHWSPALPVSLPRSKAVEAGRGSLGAVSLGQTSNPECGPAFLWMAFFLFFFPVMSTDCLPAMQCPEKGLVPPCPAELSIPQVDSGVSTDIWGPRIRGGSVGEMWGRGVGLEYIVLQGPLVNWDASGRKALYKY